MTKKEKEELREELKNYFPKGSTALTMVKKVSPSGMYRNISVHIIKGDRLLNLSYSVAKFIGWTYKDKTNAVGVGGCGMDMGFHVVSTLAALLHDDYKTIKQEWIS